jgi:MscS family membrane protein
MPPAFRLLFIALVFASPPAAAGTSNPLAPLDRSSPSATFQSFVSAATTIETDYADYLASKTATKAKALLHSITRMRTLMDLSAAPPATRNEIGGAAFGYLVDILARLPDFPAADIPGAPGRDWKDLPAKWTVPGTEISIARVDEGPHKGEYLFTGETVERLPEFHAQIISQAPRRPVKHRSWREEQVRFTGPLFPHSLLRRLPDSLQRTVLGTPIWKIASTLVIALTILLITFFWTKLVRSATRNANRVRSLFYRLTTPLFVGAMIYFADGFIQTEIHLSGDFDSGESIFAAIVVYVATAWAAAVACFVIVEAIIASPRIPDNSYDAHLLRLTARVGAVVVAGAILVYGANDIGIPALGLVAGLGVGGFALALASQSTVENLFGGVSIFADRPFRVGDHIHYGDGGGSVEAIGPRSSRIRALDGTLTTVPNGDLAKMRITNFSMRSKCLFQHKLGLRFETSPEQFERLLKELRGLISAHPMVEKSPGFPRVILLGLGDSSVNIEVRAYVLTSDFGEFLNIQEQLIFDIIKAVREAGTAFAFPSQTAYLARDEGIGAAAK